MFTQVHAACQTGSAFMSWPVMEALLNITFGALVYAAENGIAVDTHYINRAFDLTGEELPGRDGKVHGNHAAQRGLGLG
ncbi:Uncharacterised protein [Raoultella terrigena]|uniref:Uncharacterized protein n=1 Tax=Raoultella terrigena TaxID=577 RepID=A0A4U9DE03_RAOTE|nr:Uncharacterised protein [Raoultella terrigena]